MTELDFAAVDFETANRARESACAVGVTVVRNGQVQLSDSWLIQPPPPADRFDRVNTAIHGISREQCMAEGLSWTDTAQRLHDLCADLPVVAHNASFDESVWRAANRATGVEATLPPFHCTLQLSRGHLDLVDYKLPTVARHLDLDDFPHHQAAADALAAAQVTIELARRTGASSVTELWSRAPQRSTSGSSAARSSTSRRVPKSVFRTHVERPASGPSLADPDVPAPTSLDDEVVLITGELTFGSREQIQERLRLAGAGVAQNLTKKVTCLVIGAGADVRTPPLTGATGKEQKAAERIREGQRIAVIGEPELRELLERAEAEAPEAGRAERTSGSAATELSGSAQFASPALSAGPDSAPEEVPAEEPEPLPALPREDAAPENPTPARATETSASRTSSVTAAASSYQPYAAPPRQPWDPPTALRPRQPWDPPESVTAPQQKRQRRWVFHVVMWSIILFLIAGMFIIGFILAAMGAPESVWAPLVGISWLLAPLVFLAWLVVAIVRLVKGRRHRSTAGSPQ
ncbi:exonuclease domain-containing protein [Kocuria flava]|uniref:exonuclease domain-containing protein n=1 Tax=Kocuria flava TaxID=446860 RepID=UPI002F93F083